MRSLFLLVAWSWVSSEAHPRTWFNRPCTVDELLPRVPSRNSTIASEWSDGKLVEPPYGCDCSFYRARYFCEHLGNEGYHKWVPHAESEGVCKSVDPSASSDPPFPPNFRGLLFGNSHLRQVVEALMCKFAEDVDRKSIKYGGRHQNSTTIRGNVACRHSSDPDWATLVANGCVAEDVDGSKACSCTDDTGEFFLTNGAILHYHYSGSNDNKTVAEALPFHGNPSWSYYDAVFANSGNPPAMSEESAVETAIEIEGADVPFFWLSNYDGVGDISGWSESNRIRFHESGARYVNISAMTLGLDSLTKGTVENATVGDHHDPHFCLPGPPDEMGLLLLKIMWAVHHGNRETFHGIGKRYSWFSYVAMFLAPVLVLLSVCCFVWCRGWPGGRCGTSVQGWPESDRKIQPPSA